MSLQGKWTSPTPTNKCMIWVLCEYDRWCVSETFDIRTCLDYWWLFLIPAAVIVSSTPRFTLGVPQYEYRPELVFDRHATSEDTKYVNHTIFRLHLSLFKHNYTREHRSTQIKENTTRGRSYCSPPHIHIVSYCSPHIHITATAPRTFISSDDGLHTFIPSSTVPKFVRAADVQDTSPPQTMGLGFLSGTSRRVGTPTRFFLF